MTITPIDNEICEAFGLLEKIRGAIAKQDMTAEDWRRVQSQCWKVRVLMGAASMTAEDNSDAVVFGALLNANALDKPSGGA